MLHKPLHLNNLCFSLPNKTCFEGFSSQISPGSRIALMGCNGSGKSSLLRIIQGQVEPTSGTVHRPEDVRLGFVPQIIQGFQDLSGSERFQATLTQVLSQDPNVLLLDEPTNHLDVHNRRSLLRMFHSYQCTLIIASHDVDILRFVDTLWHIDNGRVHVFSGNYDDYQREMGVKRASIEEELSRLDRQKKELHHAFMKEQQRAKKSQARGQKSIRNRKWPTIVSNEKAKRAAETSGRKKSTLTHRRNDLLDQLATLRLPEIIMPKFSLKVGEAHGKTLLHITEGTVGYGEHPILTEINLSVRSGERIAIRGDNGSGKSTLIKAILTQKEVTRTGTWTISNREEMGYLDQHYETLQPNHTVFDAIHTLAPSWSHAEVRAHLNDFLFRKNEEVNALVSTLSGGEKARLSLAHIAAQTPRILTLDEPTNNLDLDTRNHMVQVLRAYPGALLIISHDEDLLESIQIDAVYTIMEGRLTP